MFTPEERERVRALILERAEADEQVAGAAIIGSAASGAQDLWSDVDVTFGIEGSVDDAVDAWTEWMERELGALHWFDIRTSLLYRVYLLPSGLQVDLSFAPTAEFGPRGPNWRTVFGETVEHPPAPPPSTRELIGHALLAVCHTPVAIARGKLWMAAYFVEYARNHTLMLACVRHGLVASYARGYDKLPREVSEQYEETLVRSIDERELRRAHAAATAAFLREVAELDPELAARLEPVLSELSGQSQVSTTG